MQYEPTGRVIQFLVGEGEGVSVVETGFEKYFCLEVFLAAYILIIGKFCGFFLNKIIVLIKLVCFGNHIAFLNSA